MQLWLALSKQMASAQQNQMLAGIVARPEGMQLACNVNAGSQIAGRKAGVGIVAVLRRMASKMRRKV